MEFSPQNSSVSNENPEDLLKMRETGLIERVQKRGVPNFLINLSSASGARPAINTI